jgi:DNA-binding transcriptional ArsR family regulator
MRAVNVQEEAELNNTAFQIYLYLVKAKEPIGPRDIMRALNQSSPAVVHRHLQKLAESGLVDKDAYGRYTVKKKIGFKGYVWVGKRLVPRPILFSVSFAGLLVFFVAVWALHLSLGSPIEESFIVLSVVTAVAAVFFLVEGLRPRTKMPQ